MFVFGRRRDAGSGDAKAPVRSRACAEGDGDGDEDVLELEVGDGAECGDGGGKRRRSQSTSRFQSLPKLLLRGKILSATFFAIAMFCYVMLPRLHITFRGVSFPGNSASSDLSPNSLTEVFQVYRPPAVAPPSAKQCQVLLMNHTFAFSYGKPFVGSYRPP